MSARCGEDYIRINDEHGGTFTYCETCPLAAPPPPGRPVERTRGHEE